MKSSTKSWRKAAKAQRIRANREFKNLTYPKKWASEAYKMRKAVLAYFTPNATKLEKCSMPDEKGIIVDFENKSAIMVNKKGSFFWSNFGKQWYKITLL